MTVQQLVPPQATPIVKPHYRPDIDGLRAIAVLAVVFYHYWPATFPGGYIGVDIFFVISGYLLGSIVISDVEAGRFSLIGFYERRIRRIFPALFALLACATVFACLCLLAPDVVAFSRSMFAASISTSNFYFNRTSNYFAAAALDRPLLHTWSLAVEEQFYLVFPLFILLIHRYLRRNLRAAVIAAALLSFAWGVITVRHNLGAAFYLPYGRIWELLTGTIIALRIVPVPRPRLAKELLAVSGLLGIVLCIHLFQPNTLFPGEAALLPCAAAAAILLAGQQATPTLTTRLLSLRPIVFIGLISYSLYLWHWPLLVFSRIAVHPLTLPPNQAAFVLLAAALILSTASWWFIERPFRTGPHRPTRRAVLVFGAACVVLFTAVAQSLLALHGRIGRFPAQANDLALYLDYAETHGSDFEAEYRIPQRCFLDPRDPASRFNADLCLAPAPGKRSVLIWGDSHAANLRSGLEASVPGVHFLQATYSSCPPTLAPPPTATEECKQFAAKILNEDIPRYSVPFVLMNADWKIVDLPNIPGTIDALRRMGVQVVLFGPTPTYDVPLPRLLARSIIDGNSDQVSRHLESDQQILDGMMARLAQDTWHVPYVSLVKLLCSQNGCIQYPVPGVPLFFDGSHLTREGSAYLGHLVQAQHPSLFTP